MGFMVAWILTVPVLAMLAASSVDVAYAFVVVCVWAMCAAAVGLIVDEYRTFERRNK